MVKRLTIMAAMNRRFAILRPAALAASLILSLTAGAWAQSVERLGDFGDWSAFRFSEDGSKACYMASRPTRDTGDYSERGDIYALVTHRPAENRRDEVSFIIGYKFKPDSFVDVAVGSETFRLFTKEDGAWTANADEDKRLVQTMIKGATMVVKGTSWRGTATTDSYSLKGFTAAYKMIGETCP
jgi:hypothetical protein